MHHFEGTGEDCEHCGTSKWSAVHFSADMKDYRVLENESLREQIAALTQRAEQAERIVADNRLADLTVPLRDYNALSKNALDLDAEWMAKLTAAEYREKRLREGIERIKQVTIDTDHDAIRTSWLYDEMAALLDQPSDAKEAEGGN